MARHRTVSPAAANTQSIRAVRDFSRPATLVSVFLPLIACIPSGCSAVHTTYGYEVIGALSHNDGQAVLDAQTLTIRLLAQGEPIEFDIGGGGVISDSGGFVAILYDSEGSVGLFPRVPPPTIPIPDQIEITVATPRCTNTIVVNIDTTTVEHSDLEIVDSRLVAISLRDPLVVTCE